MIETLGLNYRVRQQRWPLGFGGIAESSTRIPVASTDEFMVGDLLRLRDPDREEVVEVAALEPPGALDVIRGREGTRAHAFPPGAIVSREGNSRYPR